MKKIFSILTLTLFSVWTLAFDVSELPQTQWQSTGMQSSGMQMSTGSSYSSQISAPGSMTPAMATAPAAAPAGPQRSGPGTPSTGGTGGGEPGLPVGDGLLPLLSMLLLYVGVVALRRRRATSILSVVVVVVVCVLPSCSRPRGPIATTPEEYMSVLSHAVDRHQILFGQHDATVYGHTWRAVRGKSDCQDVCGDYPAIMSFDLGYLEIDYKFSIDSVPFDLIREAAIDQYERGGLVSISWHARNPVTGGDSWDNSCDSVVRSLLPGGSHHEVLNLWLSRVSTFLLSLRDPETGNLIPLIFRPWHEHSGGWFWWGSTCCTPEEFIALYRYTHSYMLEAGLTNLIWAYSPNLGVTRETYIERYPGSDYVDLLGIDCYAFEGNPREVYQENARYCLDLLTEMGETLGKPIAFTETGLQTLEDDEWFTKTLYPVVKDYPISYLLVWRNADDNPIHFYVPYPGHPTENDFRAFHDLDNIVFLSELEK